MTAARDDVVDARGHAARVLTAGPALDSLAGRLMRDGAPHLARAVDRLLAAAREIDVGSGTYLAERLRDEAPHSAMVTLRLLISTPTPRQPR